MGFWIFLWYVHAGAEGHLLYEEGQISASVEIGLEEAPSTSFVLVLLQPKEGGKLGAASKTVVSIIGEAGMFYSGVTPWITVI